MAYGGWPSGRGPGNERRYDAFGEIRFMTEADGYAMVRRPGAMPFVIQMAEWEAMCRSPEELSSLDEKD